MSCSSCQAKKDCCCKNSFVWQIILFCLKGRRKVHFYAQEMWRQISVFCSRWLFFFFFFRKFNYNNKVKSIFLQAWCYFSQRTPPRLNFCSMEEQFSVWQTFYLYQDFINNVLLSLSFSQLFIMKRWKVGGVLFLVVCIF